MKIGFVFQKDSHFKSVYHTYERLANQYNFDSLFYGIRDDYTPALIKVIWLNDENLSLLQQCDYLICCLGGYLLNKIIESVHHKHTKVISLFPGVVSRFQLDAFITRIHADQVWLNSSFDCELHQVVCRVLGVPNNGILYGASWVRDVGANNSNKISHQAIFFEQIQILDDRNKRQQFLLRLVELIVSNPKIEFLYKTRTGKKDDYFKLLYQTLNSYPNVKIVDFLSDEMIERSDIYISISSSAIIEGILSGKRCYLLGKQFLDRYALDFFKESNLFIRDNDLLSGGMPNHNWQSSKISNPSTIMPLSNIKKNYVRCDKVHPVFYRAISIVLRVSLDTKKNFIPLMNKRDLSSIKLAFRYLGEK